MSQYLIGLISGILAAGFGAWLTTWLENRKEKERDQNVFEAFKEELISNLEMLSANCVELEQEISIADKDQHLLSNITPFYFPTWDILKTRIPKELANKETFRQLALTMHLVLLINDEISSRERFKINGVALSNFAQTLKKRDQLLVLRHVKLLMRIFELKEELGLKIDFNSPSQTLMDAVETHEKEKSKNAN